MNWWRGIVPLIVGLDNAISFRNYSVEVMTGIVLFSYMEGREGREGR